MEAAFHGLNGAVVLRGQFDQLYNGGHLFPCLRRVLFDGFKADFVEVFGVHVQQVRLRIEEYGGGVGSDDLAHKHQTFRLTGQPYEVFQNLFMHEAARRCEFKDCGGFFLPGLRQVFGAFADSRFRLFQ